MFCVNEASACVVLVEERRVTEGRGGLVTVLTLAVREDLGGFQLFALERRVKEALGGIDHNTEESYAAYAARQRLERFDVVICVSSSPSVTETQAVLVLVHSRTESTCRHTLPNLFSLPSNMSSTRTRGVW